MAKKPLDNPPRNPVTEDFYPFKLTAEEFIAEITKEVSNQDFIANMNNLSMGLKYAEDWIRYLRGGLPLGEVSWPS